MPQLRRPSLSEIPVLAATLAATFADNPLYVFLFPDERVRNTDLTAYHAWVLSTYLAAGRAATVLTTGGDEGVVAWGRGRLSHSRSLESLQPTFDNAGVVERAQRLATSETSAYPAEPYLFVPFVAVVSPARGQGFGTAMLQALTAEADHLRVPVATSSPTPEAVVFLERFGFVVVAETPTSANGPRRWILTRPVTGTAGRRPPRWRPRSSR